MQEIEATCSVPLTENYTYEATCSVPLTENYTYNVHGFSYHPNSSMTGIFFFDNEGRPCFNYMRPYPFLGLPQPNFFSIPTPFTILSSTKGLILCRDFVTDSYHVLNPFIHTDASYRRIPDPPRSHESCSSAVLALDLRNPNVPSFNIICPVQEEAPGNYTFDTYSSAHDAWFRLDELYKFCRPIMMNSGMSNSRGMAFWLTEVPHVLIRYEIAVNNDFDLVNQIDLPQGLWACGSVQIGRIDGDVGVGLVASTPHVVGLFLLRDQDTHSRSWEELCFLNVNGQSQRGGRTMVACKQKQGPEILRYEKEVPLWIDGRIVLWEIFENGVAMGARMTGRLHEMPGWKKRPEPIANSIPYVHTESIPANFPVIYVDSDDDDGDYDDMLE